MSALRVAAFIPARGGSKRVPGKNLQCVGKTSLLVRAMSAALGADCDDVVVSTDDAAIAEHVDFLGIGSPRRFSVHARPAQLATDHAQIENAMQHWWVRLDGEKPDVIVLLQPTSPFRTADHVRMALALLQTSGADSVIGVTAGHESHFAGRLKPRELEKLGPWGFPARIVFHDWQPFSPFAVSERPRTQDLAPRGVENGSLYVTTRAAWERSGARVSGHTVALPMTWIEGLDIDTMEDLAAARAIAEGMGL